MESSGIHGPDSKWIEQRNIPYQNALNIYEVKLGSFKEKKENGESYSYRELVDE